MSKEKKKLLASIVTVLQVMAFIMAKYTPWLDPKRSQREYLVWDAWYGCSSDGLAVLFVGLALAIVILVWADWFNIAMYCSVAQYLLLIIYKLTRTNCKLTIFGHSILWLAFFTASSYFVAAMKEKPDINSIKEVFQGEGEAKRSFKDMLPVAQEFVKSTNQALARTPGEKKPYDIKEVPPAEKNNEINDAAVEQLKKIKTLYDEGILTEAEYQEKKSQILGK